MKNKLMDLNNHLFAQMERLSDEDLTSDQLKHEIERTKALRAISTEIISNAKLSLDAFKAVNTGTVKGAPKMLGMDAAAGELE